MKTITVKEKMLWNEAVKTTLTEMRKWDGIIPSQFDRENMSDEIYKRVAYKKITITPQPPAD